MLRLCPHARNGGLTHRLRSPAVTGATGPYTGGDAALAGEGLTLGACTQPDPQPDRSTALFTLASELPAAILARMRGIHIQVAVQWQKASAGDWAACTSRIGVAKPDPRAATAHGPDE